MSLSLPPKVSAVCYMLVCLELAPLKVEKCSWVRLDSKYGLASGFRGALNRTKKKKCKC